MPCGLFYSQTLEESICHSGVSGLVYVIIFFLFQGVINTHLSNENSADSDQMPHLAASDLSLHCLPITLLWDTWHKGLLTVFVQICLFFNKLL